MDMEELCAAPPEALAHNRPSQMSLSCPVAPSSQRELRKKNYGGGGGGGVARRARAARAPKAKAFATSCGTSSEMSCAASFTCSSFMCHQRAGVWGGLASGSPRAAAYLLLRSPRPLRARPNSSPSRVDRHYHWACRIYKGLRMCKERAAMKKPLMKKPWGAWAWGAVGEGHGCGYLEKKVVMVAAVAVVRESAGGGTQQPE